MVHAGTNASRNAIKQHFRALVERGTLSQYGGGHVVWSGLRWPHLSWQLRSALRG